MQYGQTVLVIGATGGVGSFVIQLAAARGARVIATARGDGADFVRSLDAADVTDYSKGLDGDQIRALAPGGVDVLADLVTADRAEFMSGTALVRPGGLAFSIVFAADPDALASRGVRGGNYVVTNKQALLERLTTEIDAGRLRIPVSAEVPLAKAAATVAGLRAGGARGKTVVLVR